MARLLASLLVVLMSLVGQAAARGFPGGPPMGFAPRPGFGFAHPGFFARPGFPHHGFFVHPGFFDHRFFNHGSIHNRFFFGGFFVAPGIPVAPYPAYPYPAYPFYYPPPLPYAFYPVPP
jgi:hypothetical protein